MYAPVGATVSPTTQTAPMSVRMFSIQLDTRSLNDGCSLKYRSLFLVNTEPGVEKNAAYTRRPASWWAISRAATPGWTICSNVPSARSQNASPFHSRLLPTLARVSSYIT